MPTERSGARVCAQCGRLCRWRHYLDALELIFQSLWINFSRKRCPVLELSPQISWEGCSAWESLLRPSCKVGFGNHSDVSEISRAARSQSLGDLRPPLACERRLRAGHSPGHVRCCGRCLYAIKLGVGNRCYSHCCSHSSVYFLYRIFRSSFR